MGFVSRFCLSRHFTTSFSKSVGHGKQYLIVDTRVLSRIVECHIPEDDIVSIVTGALDPYAASPCRSIVVCLGK